MCQLRHLFCYSGCDGYSESGKVGHKITGSRKLCEKEKIEERNNDHHEEDEACSQKGKMS